VSKKHSGLVQKQFTETVEAFSKFAPRDTAEMLAARVDFIKPQAHEHSLDVACGPGTLVLAMAPRLRFARGIDLTRAMLLQARGSQRESNITNACFDRGEAEQLPYADSTFEVVTSQFCFHHLLKPKLALQEMARVARPEGRVVLIDTLGPESDKKWERHNRIELERDPSHTASLRLTDFLALFEDLSLRVARQTIRRHTRSFNEWMLRAGVASCHPRYQEVRRMIEESIPGDAAGFSAAPKNGDYTIVHHEAMFWLERP
jgi:ubiquinone/menaquinone biosynthesis C-methylase UbiE